MGNVIIAGTAPGATPLPTASTIDGANDFLPIYTASLAATQAINRNTLLGLSSAPAGLTDSQTLTNKILTAPSVSSPVLSGTLTGTYTLGGSPTFPSSIVTLTGSQTLTNKILTSPVINSPTIANATISTDAITGFTTSGTGSIYGLSIAAGAFTGSNIIPTAALQAASVTNAKVATSAIDGSMLTTGAIYSGRTLVTTGQTFNSNSVDVDLAGATITVTVPTGGRSILLYAQGSFDTAAAASLSILKFYEGSTLIGSTFWQEQTSGIRRNASLLAIAVAPSAGSHTYKLTINVNQNANTTSEANTTTPLMVVALLV